MTIGEKIQIEEQILFLLLRNEENAVTSFIESGAKLRNFEERHRLLLDAILEAQNSGVSLTRLSYKARVEKLGKSRVEVIAEEQVYNRLYYNKLQSNLVITRADLPMLLDKFRDSVLTKKTTELIEKYRDDLNKSPLYAVNELQEKLKNVVEETDVSSAVDFAVVGSEPFIKSYRKHIGDKIANKTLIECGIPEVDEIMGVGFAPSTLTLFCADTGGGKSTMMLNVAIGVFETSMSDVLFIPLEMPYLYVFDKVISRETKINGKKIAKPVARNGQRLLSVAEEQKIYEAAEKWGGVSSKFAFLDMGERTTVSAIRHQIDRHFMFHKPKLVVIDYVANLLADRKRSEGNHLEIGDMLKDLIQMSKPGQATTEGFAVMSAAQIKREALTRLRYQKDQAKRSLASEDLMGSHHYGMDATNIFGLLPDPAQPNRQIQLLPIKSRWGPKMYENGTDKAVLVYRPEISLIASHRIASWQEEAKEEIAAAFSKTSSNPPVIDSPPVPVAFDDGDAEEEEEFRSVTSKPLTDKDEDWT